MITAYAFPEDSEELLTLYANNPQPFDTLVSDLNDELMISWEETFVEFLLSLHEIYRENLTLLVYWKEKVPKGLLFYVREDSTFVPYLVVSNDCRRQGIGRTLLSEINARLPDQPISLFCPRNSVGSLIFYKTNGFLLTDKINDFSSTYLMRPA